LKLDLCPEQTLFREIEELKKENRRLKSALRKAEKSKPNQDWFFSLGDRPFSHYSDKR
jgi:hypothetical protein